VFSNTGSGLNRYPSIYQDNAQGNPVGFAYPSSPVAVPTNQFVILAISYNVNTYTGTFYEGGIAVGTGTFTFSGSPAPVGDTSVCVGCFESSSNNFGMKGGIAQLLLFNTALSSASIQYVSNVLMYAYALSYPQNWA